MKLKIIHVTDEDLADAIPLSPYDCPLDVRKRRAAVMRRAAETLDLTEEERNSLYADADLWEKACQD